MIEKPPRRLNLADLDEPPTGALEVIVNGIAIDAELIRIARRVRAASDRELDIQDLPEPPSTSTITEPTPTRENEKSAHSSAKETTPPTGKGRGVDREPVTRDELLAEIEMVAMTGIGPGTKRLASVLKAKVACLHLLADHHGVIGNPLARTPGDKRATIDAIVRELAARGAKVVDRAIETPARLIEPPRLVVEAEKTAPDVMSTSEAPRKSLPDKEVGKDV